MYLYVVLMHLMHASATSSSLLSSPGTLNINQPKAKVANIYNKYSTTITKKSFKDISFCVVLRRICINSFSFLYNLKEIVRSSKKFMAPIVVASFQFSFVAAVDHHHHVALY